MRRLSKYSGLGLILEEKIVINGTIYGNYCSLIFHHHYLHVGDASIPPAVSLLLTVQGIEPDMPLMASIPDTKAIMADISANVYDSVQRGLLPADERFHQHYRAIIHQVLGGQRHFSSSQANANIATNLETQLLRPNSDAAVNNTKKEPPPTYLDSHDITPQSAESQYDSVPAFSSYLQSPPPTISSTESSNMSLTEPSNLSLATYQPLENLATPAISLAEVGTTPVPINPYLGWPQLPILEDGENLDWLMDPDFSFDEFFDVS